MKSSSPIIDVRAFAGRAHAPYVRRHLLRAHALVRSRVRELSVVLVGDARMSRLHERYMGIPGPTDVLSFELEHDARGRVIAGELIVCVPEARRQSRRHRIRVEKELLLYAVHGLLHLSGFDDRTEADYRKMHRTEDNVLSKLGVGPVFAPETQAGNKSGRATGGSR